MYLSYIGVRTLVESNMQDFYKVVAFPLIALTDTIWFPIGGTVDVVYALTREVTTEEVEPEDESDEAIRKRWRRN